MIQKRPIQIFEILTKNLIRIIQKLEEIFDCT